MDRSVFVFLASLAAVIVLVLAPHKAHAQDHNPYGGPPQFYSQPIVPHTRHGLAGYTSAPEVLPDGREVFRLSPPPQGHYVDPEAFE